MRRKKEDVINLIGKQFERLKVLDLSDKKPGYHFNCLCNCGVIKNVSIYKLETGHTKSCGCLSKDIVSVRQRANLIGQVFGNLEVIKLYGKTKFCSLVWECKCKCGKICYPTTRNLKKGNSTTCGCSHSLRGKNHPNWDDSISVEDRLNKRGTVKNPIYSQWIKDVLKKDSYKCILTGESSLLEVHHLYAWNKYPNLRFDLNNGVTLTKKIHVLFHKIYGKGSNTKEQFEEFKKYFLNCAL